MAADLTNQSDRLLSEGRALVRDNQSGGRHRNSASIGKGSARIRRSNLMKRAKFIAAALFAIVVAAGAAGIVLDGIGFTGVMITFLAIMAAIFIFSRFPKVKTPKREDLARTQDAKQLVARTELWLEHQRPALPPPAVNLVDKIGVQLDELGLQLEGIDREHPAAVETRKLVGEYLPQTVDTYRKIPRNLREEKGAGGSPDEQFVESLGKISGEIDRVTRQLASGAIDDLAVRTRYLEYKYGEAMQPAEKDD
ncbi:hypothetical protein FHS61_002727 [Altererythrobacter atlanticus]|uniref:Uncharacterized protein n=1 Tax=Croceibacterium atlanticum TaxID=1267766 RepID=A0A0F7KXB2_9SPHN|nr:hypothetical protein [Croceibacterium atlanticum]AKH43866.1 hypothetical protein WYH_02838 [Croceibacterium atlanticum]MBB5733684.1 hypothetical protein [Croceibacterium atlanticum]